MARSVSVAVLLILLSAQFGVTQRRINVCRDGHDLLHIPARLLVFSIKAFFFAFKGGQNIFP